MENYQEDIYHASDQMPSISNTSEASPEANKEDLSSVAVSESDSDMSDSYSPSNDVDEKNKKERNTNEPAKKKRKKHDPTKRRKIRKLLSEDKLKNETLEAMRQEEERRKRLEEQAQRNLQTFTTCQTTVPSIAQSDFATSSHFSHSGGVGAATTYLTSLLTSNDASPYTGSIPYPNITPQFKPQVSATPDFLGPQFSAASSSSHPTLKPNVTESPDVICISSDSEEDKGPPPAPLKPEAIDISSDSSDDVICTGEVKDEKTELEDVNNSGMHIEDAKNQRDAQGRVLVNVNRPTNEPEIFLAPQLASAVLPHQIGGIRFMYDNIVETLSHYKSSAGFGCILAHSMGLGKTLQVISFADIFLRYTEAKTVLCVVPVNTLMNWVSEFNMWLPPKSKCLDESPASVWPRSFSVHILSDYHKTVDSRSKVVSQWYDEGGVLLLGYEMYRQLTSRKQRKRRRKKSPKPNEPIDVEEEDRLSTLAIGMQESLLKPGPDLIVCDEGHRIKNSHASISQMLKNVRTRRRIVLTGYPLQNNLMEYWCMVDFVRPNFLGTKQEFSNMFERPILNGQCADSNESDVRLMRFRSHVLHSLLKGFVQRRSHSVLRLTLPFKEEHVFMIRLSQWQKKLYNSFWETKMKGSSGSWCSNINPIKAFSVCCKIWNHPDVLYRTVQERSDDNPELDPDFDLPEDSAIAAKKNRSKTTSANNPTSTDSSSARINDGSFPASSLPLEMGDVIKPNPVPPAVVPPPAFGPFGDDKDKRMSYDWAKELFTGYETGLLEMSGKMVVLMEVIKLSLEINDRLLVFSQSLSTLTLIEDFLSVHFVPRSDLSQPQRKWCKNENYFRLDGNTHSAEREKMINQFNSPDNKSINLFLLSTRAGCLGINLIGANRVVVFDASWNPCHDAQAVCRVYRYGQQKTCHIYRLVSDQSMEKKIYDRQVAKQGMSDRVVDKLNPTQVFTKQDVLSLMEYSNDELPLVDFSSLEEEYGDEVLINLCKTHGSWFTRKPFTHESLLLDCKDQRLTKAEKRLAEKGYEKDKLASSAYNYGRQSYAGFYGSSGTKPASSSINNNSSNFPSTSHELNRPIANVRPVQSTPAAPLSLQSNNPQSSPFVHKSGISLQKVVATMDIPLPPQHTPTNTTAGQQPTKIHAGEMICVIRGRKGTYIRTSQGRIFAVRLNDSARATIATSGSSTRLSPATSTVPTPSVSGPVSSGANQSQASWIDLNRTRRDHVASSSPRPPVSGPLDVAASAYNPSSGSYFNPLMPMPPQYSYATSSVDPLNTTNSFNPNPGLFNSDSMSRFNDFGSGFYGNGGATPFVPETKSYASMNMPPPDPPQFNSNLPNMFPYPPNNFGEFSDFFGVPSMEGPSTVPLRSSMSAPVLRQPPISEDSAPIDLSNPLINPSSSQDVAAANSTSISPPTDEGLEMGFPTYNW